MKKSKITPQTRQEIIRMNTNGMGSQHKIAKKLGIAQSTVSLVLRKRKAILEAGKSVGEESSSTNIDKENKIVNTPVLKKLVTPKLIPEALKEDKKSNSFIVVEYNGLNIHLNRDTVKNIYLSKGKIKVEE